MNKRRGQMMRRTMTLFPATVRGIRYTTILSAFSLLCVAGCDNPPPTQTPKVSAEPEPPAPAAPVEVEQKIIWPGASNLVPFLTKYGEEHPETHVRLTTRHGEIVLRLYEDTPLHRANFIHHIQRGLYDHTVFYRVVPGFMIQGGSSDHDETVELRKKVDAYYIPSEVRPNHIHRRGALAMAMSYDDNPDHKSAQYSFYIVIGTPFSEKDLKATEREYNFKIPEENKGIYRAEGGCPHLDGIHTVFGEVASGMEVVEAIAAEDRDSGDWPVNDVVIEYEVIVL